MTVEHLEDAPGLIAITCRRVASGFARLDPEIGMLAKHRPDPGRLRHQPFKRFPPCRACFWQQLGAISLSEITQYRPGFEDRLSRCGAIPIDQHRIFADGVKREKRRGILLTAVHIALDQSESEAAFLANKHNIKIGRASWGERGCVDGWVSVI